ncbi:phosphatase PAP2 family protein [Pedobacter rhodius]|uniref:Phosphatase PAP2 family protein n=1 Tax=Pedobacter rhodius TaxID=3004098 RepID=A0ABT4KVW4_9SPHI|nr:phosphatase PAP2 family protein [Pedobacter sp. SJ11]MCZ4223069.1 phosphatase PAP2 family protein [Pedobacter sp. SJ11]
MFKNPKLLILIFFILLTGFVTLSVFIAYNPIVPFDVDVSLAVQKYQAKWLDYLMLAISLFGELPWSLVSVLVVAAIFYFNKFKRESYFIALVLCSGLIILGMKNIINRPRPTSFYVRLVEVNRFQSFPSGHVLSYVLFFGFLIILMRNLTTIATGWRRLITIIAIFLIIMIAPSRIYLGAHWFTDTLGGFLLGLICLYPLAYFYLNRNRQIDSSK